uniref:Putative secreted protein n=1 Tax=Amblyomma triste TaxID=251400 RepID=A0A023G4N2_AMBTT
MPASLPWIRWLFFASLLAFVYGASDRNRTAVTTEEAAQPEEKRVCKGELRIPFMPCARYCRVSWIAFFPKYKRWNLPDGTSCKRFLLFRGVCKDGKCVKQKRPKVTKRPGESFTPIIRTAEPTTTTLAPLSND